MSIIKIIQNARQVNFTVFSDKAPKGKASYQLNFQPLCEVFGIKPKEQWFIFHYNKFEKLWGLVRGQNLAYTLINKDKLQIPQLPLFLLMPDDRFPEALIRGVMFYNDLPEHTGFLPPAIFNVEDYQDNIEAPTLLKVNNKDVSIKQEHT